MKVVLDTNVIISGLLFGGNPEIILEAAQTNALSAYTSDFLLEEATRILRDKFHIDPAQVKETERLLRSVCTVVKPKSVPTILRDTPDNQVLAITHEAKIEAIITGDKELLAQKEYNGVPIVTVEQFVARYNLGGGGIS
jgi:putative PIN family toxin of toxin-antitoxin system